MQHNHISSRTKIYNMIMSILMLALLALMTGCGSASASSNESGSSNVPETHMAIVLGDVSDDPVKKIEEFQPLADYLAANLAEHGFTVGEVRIAPDIETMTSLLQSGEVDLYFDSLYPTMMVNHLADAQPILRRWKGGDADYHSVFFALAGSNLHSLDDLSGHKIAFEEPFSTSGYMLPLATMVEHGLNPVDYTGRDTSVGAGEVGYVFSSDDHNTIQWVLSGRIDAGVVDNQTFSEIPEDDLSDLIIFARTATIPRQVAMVRAGLDPEVIEAITALLVDLDETEEGQQILDTIKSARFDIFPEGAEHALENMRRLYELVNEG